MAWPDLRGKLFPDKRSRSATVPQRLSPRLAARRSPLGGLSFGAAAHRADEAPHVMGSNSKQHRGGSDRDRAEHDDGYREEDVARHYRATCFLKSRGDAG
jgi:hypothetical protein